ncbi:hypothetical protein [Flavobacterium filum]|uniref:hypothetical protein n=1 Tax=Flavobacterium filum TaxID=370974 RepID=UPI0023F57B70|nr:hypothetical protein [Flavobacterium filum]
MDYLHWNKVIASYLFNPERSGQDVYLYLTQQDIINLGKDILTGKNDSEIWDDFTTSLQNGPENTSPDSIIVNIIKCYKLWKLEVNKSDKYPFYLTYLIFLILPLTDSSLRDFSVTNYYGKINTYVKKYRLGQNNINTQVLSKLDILWTDLEEWSILTCNTNLGIFESKIFGNPYLKYVGKMFAQCVFPPKAIKKLPFAFLVAGMVPNTSYTFDEIKDLLLRYGVNIIGLKDKVINFIKDDKNELGKSLIEIALKEYKKWNGVSHVIESDQGYSKITMNNIMAPLFLQLKPNLIDETVEFSYRMRSNIDFPADLKFGDLENIYEGNGWSKTLNISFQENLILFDEYNKWQARFRNKSVRLFIPGSQLSLSNAYWIETDNIVLYSEMMLLCNESSESEIINWGKTFKHDDFSIVELSGIPEGYKLFRFRNPTTSCPDYDSLIVHTEKYIIFDGGLKVGYRTYLNKYLPHIKVENSIGNELVYVKYVHDNETQFLQKKEANIWELPGNIKINTSFTINIQGENLPGYEVKNNITNSDFAYLRTSNLDLPKRNSFGMIDDNAPKYMQGSNVIGIETISYLIYKHLFRGNEKQHSFDSPIPQYEDHYGNTLLSFLTLKQISTIEEFFGVFEYFHNIKFNGEVNAGFNYTLAKKAAINTYDFLGYLDYDYESKRIVVNPPQLCLIPSEKGRKAILIGGRDNVLVNKIIQSAGKYHLIIEVKKQLKSNSHMLLPDTIMLSTHGNFGNFGEDNIKSIANEVGIKFNPEELIQPALMTFAASIDEYENHIQTYNRTENQDFSWVRKIFDVNSLRFENLSGEEFDKTYTLVEYKLTEYDLRYRFWKNGNCYIVDKNWGRYMALKKAKKAVIRFDENKNKVAIPASLPLPRLLAESITLLSGTAPETKKIYLDSCNYYWFNIYENIPDIFIKNLFQKLNQEIISCTID